MRPAAILSLLFAASFARAQDVRINYTANAVPLSQAVAAVAKQSGQSWQVDDEIANEPVVLRLVDVSSKDVMTKLGDEFVADWVMKKGVLWLERTPEKVAEFQKKLDADRLKAFQKSVDDIAKLASAPPLTDERAHVMATSYITLLQSVKSHTAAAGAEQQLSTYSDRTADTRLMAKMVVAIGAQKLAAAEGNSVFAIDPTPTEIAVEGITDEDIKSYVAQRNSFANILNSQMPKGLYDGSGSAEMIFATHVAKAPIRVLLRLESDAGALGTSIALTAYNADGTLLTSFDRPFANSFDPESYSADLAKTRNATKDDPDILIPPLTQELATRSLPNDHLTLSEEATAFLLHPEDKDPLSLGFGDVLLREAELENRNLIASTADDGYRLPHAASVKSAVNDYNLQILLGNIVDRPDGWLVVKNKNPLAASDSRLSRPALGEFIRTYANLGSVTLKDWAKLASQTRDSSESLLPYQYLRWYSGTTMIGQIGSSWPALQLYGMLSPEQQDTLGAGASLDFATLSPEIQTVLRNLVYQERNIKAPPKVIGQQASMVIGIGAEPTESVPNGIPGDAKLTATQVQTDLFFMTMKAFMKQEQPGDVNEVARYIVDLDTPSTDPDNDFRIAGLRYGGQYKLTFDLSLTPGFCMETQLHENRLPKGDPIPIDKLADQLPPDAWAKLQAAIDSNRAVRQRFRNAAPSQPKTPPPPPR